jgi:hypothetical protein
MRRLIAALTAVAAAFVTWLSLGTPAHAADTAKVSVVHGIPNTPVNVFVNGKSTLPNFQPGTVAGPLDLPAGTYKVDVFPAADTAGTGTPVITASASVTAGQNVTLVAHLTADGKPTLTPFVNDISTIAAGKARLVVRHTAAAPGVDVRANGAVAFPGLTNPNEAKADLAAGSISADVVLAGTTTVAIGPATLNLAEGTSTIVYAIGSATDKTLSLVTQTITGLHSNPNGVPGGTGGFAAASGGDSRPIWLVALAGAGLLIAGGAGLRLKSARN